VDQTAFVLVGVSRNSFFKYDDIQDILSIFFSALIFPVGQ